MSTKIVGTTINHTRSDTLQLIVSLTKDGVDYECADGDTCRFAMKKKYTDETPLINKDMPCSGCSAYLELDPSDTATLETGKYVYDIEITTADGVVDTIIPPDPTEEAHFVLGKEVY